MNMTIMTIMTITTIITITTIRESTLVLLFNCRDLREDVRMSLSDFSFHFSSLRRGGRRRRRRIGYPTLSRLAREGRLTVLIDGLDEQRGLVLRLSEGVARANAFRAERGEEGGEGEGCRIEGAEFIYGILLGCILGGSRVLCTGRDIGVRRVL